MSDDGSTDPKAFTRTQPSLQAVAYRRRDFWDYVGVASSILSIVALVPAAFVILQDKYFVETWVYVGKSEGRAEGVEYDLYFTIRDDATDQFVDLGEAGLDEALKPGRVIQATANVNKRRGPNSSRYDAVATAVTGDCYEIEAVSAYFRPPGSRRKVYWVRIGDLVACHLAPPTEAAE